MPFLDRAIVFIQKVSKMIKNVESVKRNAEILHVSKVTGKTTFSELNLPVSNRLTLELLYAGTFIKKI